MLYDGVYFSTYWNKVVQSILKISYTTLQIKLSLYHFSTLLEAYICHFMTMIPACRHNKTLLDRPRTHSTGPINPSSSRAPTSSSPSTGKRAAERSDRGAIEEEADRPLHAVMAGHGFRVHHPRTGHSPSSPSSILMGHASIRVLPALSHAYLPQFFWSAPSS